MQYQTQFGTDVNVKPDPSYYYLCCDETLASGFTYLMKLVMIAKTSKILDLIKKEITDYPQILNESNSVGMTALHLASIHYNNLITQIAINILLNAGININKKDDMGKTALHYASALSRINVVKLLVYNKADINLQTNDGDTALHMVSNTDKCKFLIEMKAKLNVKNSAGCTALNSIVRYFSNKKIGMKIDMIRSLLHAGSNPNNKDNNGKTPFYYICEYSRIFTDDLVKEFLDYNADPNIMANGYTSPFSITCLRTNTTSTNDTVKLLFNSGARLIIYSTIVGKILNGGSFHSVLWDLCRNFGRTQLSTVDYICNMTLKDWRHEILLYYALCYLCVRRNNFEFVKLVMSKLCKSSFITGSLPKRITALHRAVTYSRACPIETIKYLIDYGLDVNATNIYGMTPLHLACQSVSTTSTTDAIKLLIDCGADPKIKNCDGNRPFDLLPHNISITPTLSSNEMINMPFGYVVENASCEMLNYLVHYNYDYLNENFHLLDQNNSKHLLLIELMRSAGARRSVKSSNKK